MADREPPTSATDDAESDTAAAESTTDLESLRERVEEKYDFDHFRPADMAEMTLEEWEAAFDLDTWITGRELLDRVAAELRSRVADGRLFAVIERHTIDGDPVVLAYSDTEYVLVHADGTVSGAGRLLAAVEPAVALCSMESYDVPTPPSANPLPDPETIEPRSGDLGHRLLLALAVVQIVAGVVLLGAPLVVRLGPGSGALTTVIGLGFVLIGVVLGALVANARLSERFRAAEYRDRLRGAGVGSDERPGFLPRLDDSQNGGDRETT